MKCLKCGKETKDERLFCKQCLASMDAYPIKPDVHVHLPSRTTLAPPKKSWRKRRVLTAEEQLAHLRTTVHRMVVLVLLLLLLLCVSCAMLAHQLTRPAESNLGRNYTYDSSIH